MTQEESQERIRELEAVLIFTRSTLEVQMYRFQSFCEGNMEYVQGTIDKVDEVLLKGK